MSYSKKVLVLCVFGITGTACSPQGSITFNTLSNSNSSSATNSSTAATADSSASDPNALTKTPPTLSYSGSSGTTGIINQLMTITPTTLTLYGATISNCGIKPFSSNAEYFPGTLLIDPSTCTISGIPLASLVATDFTVVATTDGGDSNDAVVTLSVGTGVPSLSYTGATGTTGAINQPLSIVPPILYGNGAPITACNLKSGSTNSTSFPGTLSINSSTCAISGTPTQLLSATYTIVAINSSGSSADAPVTVTVGPGVPALSYSSSPGTTGTINQPLSVSPSTLTNNGAAITACGIKPGSANASNFPGSLSVNSSTCTISGTPTAALSGTFILVASNSAGPSNSASVTLTIQAGIPTLSFSGATGTTGAVNHAMSVVPTLSDNGSAITSCGLKPGSANINSFPGTLSINSTSCVISGTPTAMISATPFTLVATNHLGSSSDAIVTLTIGAGGVPSLSYSGASGTGAVNQAMSVAPTSLVDNGVSVTACGVKVPTPSLPSWASVNANTCTISGTPTSTLPSTTYTLVAKNSMGDSADATVTLLVSAGVPSLSYSGASGTTGAVHQSMSVTPTLLDNGAAVTACGIKSGTSTASSFPTGLSVNSTSCVISGTPTATLPSTVFTLVVTNSAGPSEATVTLSVGASIPSLSYSGASNTSGSVNQSMTVTPTLSNNGAPVTSCALKAGSSTNSSFPGTLSINATTCAISGTPTAVLSSTVFTLVATNSAGPSEATVTLAVGATTPSLSYSGVDASGSVNHSMTVTPTLSDNGATITACGLKSGSTNAGSFPGTLSINSSSCVISGTPTAILSATAFTLVASNHLGSSSDAVVTITIGAGGVPSLSYSGASGTTGTVNVAMSVTPTTLTGNGLSISACHVKVPTTALPAWASVNSSTCIISGTPTDSLPSTTYTLIATNSMGDSADATVALTVNAAVPSLSYAGASGTSGTVNQSMSVTPTTALGNGAPITTCALKSGSTSLPGTLSIDASSCVISGTPTATLTSTVFTLIASNSAGPSSEALVSLSVGAAVPTLSYSGASGTTGTINQSMSVTPHTLTDNGSAIISCGIKSGSNNEGIFPSALAVNATSCVISGTPTATLPATPFTLVATNGAGSSSSAIVSLTIAANVPSLSYSGASGTTGTVNQSMSVTPSLVDNGEAVTTCALKAGSATANSFPGTLSINASTCVISGTPTATLPSTVFTLVATNNEGPSEATVSLSVGAGAPYLDYSGSGTYFGNVAQNAIITPTLVSNGATVTACTIKAGSTNAGSFPGTLTINSSTCVITGTPTAILNTTSFTLVASSSAGPSSDAVLSLNIAGAPPSLSYASATGTTGMVNQLMTVTPSLNENGASVTSCSIKSGSGNYLNFPGTLSVNSSTCVISGTPTTTMGSTQFTIVANNSVGPSSDAVVSLTINAGYPVLSYAGASGTTGLVGSSMSVSPTAFSSSGATLTSCGILNGTPSLPSGLSVSASSCTIFGTPTATVTNTTYTIVAANSAGLASSNALVTLNISQVTQQAYLKSSNIGTYAGAGEMLGESVAISGDTIVVGASNENSNQSYISSGSSAATNSNAIDSGAAYVFVRSGNTWSQQAYLKVPNVNNGQWFGSSVAIDGDTIVAGATGENSNQSTITNGSSVNPNASASASGAVYVFTRSGTMWSQQAYLKAPNVHESDQFGGSVAISADTIVVGAKFESSNQSTITNGTTASADLSKASAGAAYVFVRSSGSVWSQQAYLKAPNANATTYQYFGTSVAISGDRIVVGAPGESSNQSTITNSSTASANVSSSSSGAAYVFVRSGSAWTQHAYLKAPNVRNGDLFGNSVSISGDTIVVGASQGDSMQSTITNGNTASADASKTSAGAAYVFIRSVGNLWSQQAYLKPANVRAGDQFGASVAISGDKIVVGAPYESSNQSYITNGATAPSDTFSLYSGAAYVFTRTGTAWSQQAYVKAAYPSTADHFGNGVAISGNTIVAGAPNEDNNQSTITQGSTVIFNGTASNSGAAYVFTW